MDVFHEKVKVLEDNEEAADFIEVVSSLLVKKKTVEATGLCLKILDLSRYLKSDRAFLNTIYSLLYVNESLNSLELLVKSQKYLSTREGITNKNKNKAVKLWCMALNYYAFLQKNNKKAEIGSLFSWVDRFYNADYNIKIYHRRKYRGIKYIEELGLIYSDYGPEFSFVDKRTEEYKIINYLFKVNKEVTYKKLFYEVWKKNYNQSEHHIDLEVHLANIKKLLRDEWMEYGDKKISIIV
jgi:hypothetical protein